MPDPAIEAHKAGLDYTEPTGKGIRKAKVSYEWVRDPNNPSAPPRQRRIIEAAPKKGMFEKLFGGGGGGNGGGGGQANAPVPIPLRATVVDPGAQQAGFQGGPPTYDWLGRPKYPKPQPRYLPQLNGGQSQQNTWNQPPVLLQPTPLPPNIDSMPWGERRYWYKMREEQQKAMKLLQKAARDAQKAQAKEVQIKQKAFEKQRLREIKEHEKRLKYLRKHPHRQLPIPGVNYPTHPNQTVNGNGGYDPLSFMLSTGEEFGVRRPFDAPGIPRQLGGPPGHAGWPMMSRTMTHAVRDLSREERVHALQAGRAWDQTW